MSIELSPRRTSMPHTDSEIKRNVIVRRRIGTLWRTLFLSCIVLGMIALGLLLFRVLNDAGGYVAIVQKVAPATLADRPLAELSAGELAAIVKAKISKNVQPARSRAAVCPA